MTTDWLKDLDNHNQAPLLELVNKWWRKEAVPASIKEAGVASLYKKGNSSNLENYTPISLLNVIYKLMAAIAKWRIEEGIAELIV